MTLLVLIIADPAQLRGFLSQVSGLLSPPVGPCGRCAELRDDTRAAAPEPA